MYLKNNFRLLTLLLLLITVITGCTSTSSTEPEQLSLKTPRFGHAAVNDGHKIYVLAGSNKSGLLSDIEVIDPSVGEVKVLANLLIPRRYFSAVWDGKHSIYIIGGVSYQNKRLTFERRVEVFNTITHEVSFAESIPLPTRNNSSILSNGKIYVFGGSFPGKTKLIPVPIVSVLDLTQNVWSTAAKMPTARETRAVLKDGLIYTVGGYDEIKSVNAFERFNPKTDTWEVLTPIPEGVSAHSATVVKNKLFLFGNYDNLTSTYCYDFNSQQWEKVNIGYKASRHNAATTLGDTTYVIGGTIGSNGPFLDYIQQFKLRDILTETN